MRRVTVVLAAALVTALPSSATTAATSASSLRVGLVVSIGVTPNNRNILGLPYLGFVRAVKAFHVQGRVVQVAPNEDATSALAFLARQRYDLIIMAVPQPPGVLDSVALDFPDAKFLLTDAPLAYLPHRPKNVQGEDFRVGEAAYLAGYLAALMETRRSGRDVVGTVGGYKVSGVDRWIVPFRAGARRANARITTLNTYTNDFVAPSKCHRAALDQIAGGAGVVFQVAGGCGLGTLRAAAEKHVWGVGVDVDESYLGPHILTSAMLRDDRAVYLAVERLVDGRFTTGGDTVYNLANGGVALGRISPKVPRSFLSRLKRVRRDIIAGRIRPPRVS
jgi:basic membrane protein A and related proteins